MQFLFQKVNSGLGLMQQFRILPEVEGRPPSEQYLAGITCLPRPFKVILQPRH